MKIRSLTFIMMMSFFHQAQAMDESQKDALKEKFTQNINFTTMTPGKKSSYYDELHQSRAERSAKKNAQDILETITPLLENKVLWEQHKIFDEAITILTGEYKKETLKVLYEHNDTPNIIKSLIATNYLK